MRSVGVFCGARGGHDPKYLQAARVAGRMLAERGLTLVYGGGHVGMMGAVADGALGAGGQVIGVIPQRLVDREQGHRGITRLEVVPDMAVRKERLIELSDAFVCLPGGLGTLDELFEVLTLRQIGYHAKATALYDQDGYFQPLVAVCQSFARAGFVDPRDVDRLIVGPDFGNLLERLAAAG